MQTQGMVVGALRIVGWILGNPDPDCIGRVAFLENTSPRASAGQDCFVRGGENPGPWSKHSFGYRGLAAGSFPTVPPTP